MKIVFRCSHCETMNEIPSEFQYRQCRKCSTLITYDLGESILCEDQNDDGCLEFMQSNTLSTELAEKFFLLADEHTERISLIVKNHENLSSNFLDIPAASLPDTVLLLLRENSTETFDELVRNCKLFDIDLKKIEQIIKRMKNEGMVYHPKGWLIRLI
ncbi:MAG: hypothetical protein ACTSQF_07570 [Candidatus Heimdallarchaeaceae archaeon]